MRTKILVLTVFALSVMLSVGFGRRYCRNMERHQGDDGPIYGSKLHIRTR